MPKWVTKLDGLVEEENDPPDVIAFKRFLNGDDTYRNQRLKVIPSVADGPLAIRLIAPPKREVQISCALLPVTWRKYEAEVAPPHGRKLEPLLEIELDCVQTATMRAMAALAKRNIKSVALDVAIVISKPEGQKEEEPEACVGIWRFNKIDVSECCSFPDAYEEEAAARGQHPDVFRASAVVGLNRGELEKILLEAGA